MGIVMITMEQAGTGADEIYDGTGRDLFIIISVLVPWPTQRDDSVRSKDRTRSCPVP